MRISDWSSDVCSSDLTQRVLDTPLDETTIAGLTVGMASHGMKPVAEAPFDGFLYPTVDFIVCHAARMRYRLRGSLTCPKDQRVPWGGGIRAPDHHSDVTQSHSPPLASAVRLDRKEC